MSNNSLSISHSNKVSNYLYNYIEHESCTVNKIGPNKK
jgi:hypothetical protein